MAELLPGVEEERVALLLRQQIGCGRFVEAIRGARRELVRCQAHAVTRGKRIARRPGDDVAGRCERRTGIGAATSATVAAGEVAILPSEAIALVVLECSEYAAAIPGETEILAGHDLIGAIGAAIAHHGFGTAEVFARDEVDDTGDGIGTVDGRGAVDDDFHALERGSRNDVRIVEALDHARRCKAATVDEQQCGLVADAAQIDARNACRVGGAVLRAAQTAFVRAEIEHLRDLASQIAARRNAGVHESIAVETDGRRAGAGNATDAAARDHDFFQCRCRRGALLRVSRHRNSCQRTGADHGRTSHVLPLVMAPQAALDVVTRSPIFRQCPQRRWSLRSVSASGAVHPESRGHRDARDHPGSISS